MRKVYAALFVLLLSISAFAQDIHFSQYYASPLTLNPAQTGKFDGEFRVAGNYRNQWPTISNAYTTATVSLDMGILKNRIPSNDQFGIGFLGFNDRAAGYLTDEADDQFSRIGFRWDFLLYSATAVYAGWYFIFHKKFEDKFYRQLFNTYLIANGFWILVIRASFSNRFAYLSWFIMGVIIVYPFLKMQFFNKQNKVLGNVIFLYFAFTYILTVILAK